MKVKRIERGFFFAAALVVVDELSLEPQPAARTALRAKRGSKTTIRNPRIRSFPR